MNNIEIVEAAFQAFRSDDPARMVGLLAEEFTFTSPQDDHIDRAAFFDRCFPTAERLRSQETLAVVPATGDDVLAVYEYELRTGERHRNVELSTVRDGRITEIQVFFGGRVPGP